MECNSLRKAAGVFGGYNDNPENFAITNLLVKTVRPFQKSLKME